MSEPIVFQLFDGDGVKPIGDTISTIPTTASASSFTLGGTLVHKVSAIGTPVADTTIPVSGSVLVVSPSGIIIMTATPTLSAGIAYGQEIVVYNQTGGLSA